MKFMKTFLPSLLMTFLAISNDVKWMLLLLSTRNFFSSREAGKQEENSARCCCVCIILFCGPSSFYGNFFEKLMFRFIGEASFESFFKR